MIGRVRSRKASLDSAGGGDGDRCLGGSRRAAVGLDLLHDVKALDDLTCLHS